MLLTFFFSNKCFSGGGKPCFLVLTLFLGSMYETSVTFWKICLFPYIVHQYSSAVSKEETTLSCLSPKLRQLAAFSRNMITIVRCGPNHNVLS